MNYSEWSHSTSIWEIATPEWSNTGLTAEIPHLEGEVLVFKGFHVETDGWNCRDNFVELHTVYNTISTAFI